MQPAQEGSKAVDAYHAQFPPPVRRLLDQVRTTILAATPGAGQKIAYGMPTITLLGRNFVHYAAWAKHVGFYPGGAALEHFAQELAGFESARGSVQFPLGAPMPLALIRKIVKFRLAADRARAAAKKPAVKKPATKKPAAKKPAAKKAR